MKSLQKEAWRWLVPLGITAFMVIILRFVFLFGYVPTESMEPTLEKGSYVLGFRIYGELEVGDIVIFRHAGKLLVKRIVAVGGGQIEHNGTSLTVPEGCYYVLGDNAECSWDSRHWEEPFVEEDEIVAKTIQGFQPMIEAVESMGLDASIVYPAGICGPYDYAFGATAEFVENLCNGNMPVGVEGTFNSVDARDLAEGVVACVEKGRPGEGYIMSNDLLTIERMCRIMCDISGAPMPGTFISAEMMKAGAIAQIPEDADREAQIQEIEYSVYNITRNNNFSCEKAKRELGYHTRPVEETIADEVAWLADEGKITIKNDVCVITGGGSGMGLEAAKLIGKTQKIVLAGRTVSKLELAKQELEELGVKVSVFGCDVSDRESVERLAEFAAGIGTIRSVIHAAGLSPHMGNGETIFGVNAMGTIHINEVVSKYMKQGGTIIDVSSMSAYMLPAEQVPYQVYELALENEEGFKQGALAMLNAVPQEMQQDMAYTVSENFVLWYAKKSALKLGKDGIRVISVSPGTFDTPMGETEGDFPVQMAKNGALGRIGKPKEIASLFAFLVSDGASYITGTDILCDGGTIAAVQSAKK